MFFNVRTSVKIQNCISLYRLDVALGSLVWWLVTLHIAGGLKLNDHCGPFQPRPFYDLYSVVMSCLGFLWFCQPII